MEDNDEKEKESIDIEFYLENADPKNFENSIDFRWSGVQEEDEEDIDNISFIKNYKNKLMRKFSTKLTRWLFDDFGIVPNEKKIK